MKSITTSGAVALLSLALVSCEPPSLPNNTAADETRRQLEETRAAYEQQAADMQSRSEGLQQQLADLQRSIQEKENAELQAKLDAIQKENEKLMADAEEARRKSEELRDQLAAAPVITQPAPYLPPAPEPGGQAWVDPSADYSMFYEELNPYGQWLDVEGYGYAWQPNLASRSSWRPYVDGRWVWSEHGWAWDTPEPFGWACYHYGRWVRIARHGWVWVPGREWAPAWVSWRSGDDCVGWAPLPPERRRGYTSVGYDCDVSYGLAPSSYVFIESVNFGRSSYVNACLSPTRITSIFGQTVNVTNIVQINVQQTNFFVHRGGPDRGWLEQRCGSRLPVAPVRIARTLERPGSGRGAQNGVRDLIAAPLPSGRADRPRGLPRIADKITRPAIEDAWTEVPNDRRQNLREVITRQARGPKPVLPVVVNEPPQSPGRDREPGPGMPREMRPPLPGGRPTPSDPVAERERRPGMTRPGIDIEEVKKAELTRREAELNLMRQREEAAKQAEDMKTREAQAKKQQDMARAETEAAQARSALMAQKEELARRQAEAAAMTEKNEELRRQQAEAIKMREVQAAQQMEMLRRQRDAETLRTREAAMAKQQELARKQAETAAMAEKNEELRRQQAEAMKARDAAAAEQQEMARRQREVMAEKANQAAMVKQQQAEMNRRAQDAKQAEMAQRQREAMTEKARQAAAEQQAEMANRQREIMAEKARQAAAEQQAEMANRQREIMRQQQEAAQRAAAQEAAQRAAQEAQRRAQESAPQRVPEPNRRPPEEPSRDTRRQR